MIRIERCDEEAGFGEAVDRLLDQHAEAVGHAFDPRPLNLRALGEDGTFLGGLSGYGQLGWLFIKLLALSPAARGQGAGKRLIEAAEEFARDNNLGGVYLDTYEFQAPEFYRKLGYREFGRLPALGNRPSRIWFCKVLEKDTTFD